jgi:hypothetical protein
MALAALVGVLAMHGFSIDHALAGPTMTADADSVQTIARPVTYAGVTREHDAAATPSAWDAASAVAGESSCPMSHSECLATLRSTPYGKYPIGFGVILSIALASSRLPTASTQAIIVGRSPPDVCLARLCISRT